MDSGPYNLWFAAFALSVFIMELLAMVCRKASDMSGGKLKHLEDYDPSLFEKLDELYPLREEWVCAGRLCYIAFLIMSMFTLLKWRGLLESDACLGLPLAAVLLSFVLTELISLTLGIAATARMLLFFLPIFMFFSYIFFPLTMPLGGIARYIKRKRVTRKTDSVATVEDEILSLVEDEADSEDGEKSESGNYRIQLDDYEKRMIVGALELDDVNVRRIMTPRVEITGVEYEPKRPVEEFVANARQAIVESGHSRIPVYQGTIDNVIGVVYSKDLLNPARTGDIDSLLHSSPLFIPVSKNIGDLLGEFQQSKIHLAIVVDEYGGTAGIVTFEDVLETLVGDIKDEYDTAEGNLEPRKIDDDVYLCDARVLISRINRLLDTEIPEDEDFDTLGGFITSSLGRIPLTGDVLEVPPLKVTVRNADKRRLIEVEVSILKQKEKEE
ncbi:MAG: HlyC/CorC family transporter [Victivallales bacterium]|nr:HlyC/CorC family transporter [Victivallales bacterium]